MKKYLFHFRYLFMALLTVLLLLFMIIAIHSVQTKIGAKGRNNNQCTTEERVFDYADKLTDAEEEKLRKLIRKREAQTGCDIVLVTLNESLADYVEKKQGNTWYDESEYVKVYADNFYDEHVFGYDKPYGDGVIYVDNWHREEDGRCYTWFSTSGKAQTRYTNAMISHLVDKVCSVSNISPYYSYKMYVNNFYYDMCGFIRFSYQIPFLAIFGIAVIITGFYLLVKLSNNEGEKTTGANTYVNGGKSHIIRQDDILVNQYVTRRHIESNSGGGSHGGGGGGHHMSSGGHSHGGGGGHH